MSVWIDTIEPESHIAGNVHRRWPAGCDDTGCTGNGEYTTLWDVYITGESAGGGGDSRSARSADSTAVYADDGRYVDTDSPGDTDRRKALSDGAGTIQVTYPGQMMVSTK